MEVDLSWEKEEELSALPSLRRGTRKQEDGRRRARGL